MIPNSQTVFRIHHIFNPYGLVSVSIDVLKQLFCKMFMLLSLLGFDFKILIDLEVPEQFGTRLQIM